MLTLEQFRERLSALLAEAQEAGLDPDEVRADLEGQIMAIDDYIAEAEAQGGEA